MLGVDWVAVGSISAAIATLLAVGAFFSRWLDGVIQNRRKPSLRTASDIAEVNRKLEEIGKAVRVISETLTGRDPTPFEPKPPPGLVQVVLRHSAILAELTKTDNPPELD